MKQLKLSVNFLSINFLQIAEPIPPEAPVINIFFIFIHFDKSPIY